jgi:hypothetical protein
MDITIKDIILATGMSRVNIAKIFETSRQNLSHIEKKGTLSDGLKFKLLYGDAKQKAIWRMVKAYRRRKEIEKNYGSVCVICGEPAFYRFQAMSKTDGILMPDFKRLPIFYCEKHGRHTYALQPGRVKQDIKKISAFKNTMRLS